MISTLKKYQYHIISTVVFIIISHFLNTWFQAVIALMLIFSFGIIHGSNDLQLIQKKTQKKSKMFFWRTLLLYIGVVLIGILLFFLLPASGLLFFVVFSAFHFGEQHLAEKVVSSGNRFLKQILYIGYGFVLFGMLFTLQWNDVHQIVYQISEVFISKRQTELLFYFGLLLFLLSSLMLNSIRTLIFGELLVLILIGYLFSHASLLLGFGIYFVIWHSIPSIQDQLDYLYPNKEERIKPYLLSSSPYWLASLLGLGFVYFFFDIQVTAFLPLFFSFLAAITFPHTVVMGWLKLSEKKGANNGNDKV